MGTEPRPVWPGRGGLRIGWQNLPFSQPPFWSWFSHQPSLPPPHHNNPHCCPAVKLTTWLSHGDFSKFWGPALLGAGLSAGGTPILLAGTYSAFMIPGIGSTKQKKKSPQLFNNNRLYYSLARHVQACFCNVLMCDTSCDISSTGYCTVSVVILLIPILIY